jgi:hypothetical protein
LNPYYKKHKYFKNDTRLRKVETAYKNIYRNLELDINRDRYKNLSSKWYIKPSNFQFEN